MNEVQYVDGGITAIFNGRSYRRDKRTGYYLAAKPNESGVRQRLHIAVWEAHNGKVPEGLHVHHVDHDKTNNEIGNLQAMTAAEHLKHHAQTMTDETREKLRKNLIEKAIPKAAEWHGSEVGRKWHSENSKRVWAKAEPIAYECTNCGKPFESLRHYGKKDNRFCSNACKSAYRRKMGYDDVTIPCEVCGELFTANKYQKRTKCNKCALKRSA